MNTIEMKRLLAKISLGDNRQVDQLVIDDWMETIGHLPYQEAYEAVVAHRRDSTEYLQPAHIKAGVKRTVGSNQPPPFSELARPGRFAPAPDNMAAMTAAYQSGDQAAVDREVAAYEKQIGQRVHALRVGEEPR